MRKVKWQYERLDAGRHAYARTTRTEIIVRVENVGDTTKYAEFGYPKSLGVVCAAEQAILEVKDEDIVT